MPRQRTLLRNRVATGAETSSLSRHVSPIDFAKPILFLDCLLAGFVVGIWNGQFRQATLHDQRIDLALHEQAAVACFIAERPKKNCKGLRNRSHGDSSGGNQYEKLMGELALCFSETCRPNGLSRWLPAPARGRPFRTSSPPTAPGGCGAKPAPQGADWQRRWPCRTSASSSGR